MPVYNIRVGACDLGQVEAQTEQQARDLAAQMVGYESEAELGKDLEQTPEVVAERVD